MRARGVARKYASEAGGDESISPGPMNPDNTQGRVLSNWRKRLLRKRRRSSNTAGAAGSLTARANMPVRSRPHSVAFGASAGEFSHEAGAMLDNTCDGRW
ncbi:hypothetical protein KCP70_07185 [Salmonella enterica subsp. enterica]|nr:hypothetical protein KCP70_07185 [Salmonella enterica subsp. enterica]